MSKIQPSTLEPNILQKFKVIKKLGSGAYGHVYKVQDRQTLQIYALKKIFDAFQHSTDAQRTFREIEVLQQVSHPNIIKLYQIFSAQNNQDVYLLFQYMESDLHNAILDNVMKDMHFRFITYQIATALKYLHSAELIHRDLKPSNILVNSDCKIKLCDFGLVRSLSNLNEQNNVLTQGVATRWYRAPQILLGSKSYSKPVDIWSLGCIIYQMLERKPLFSGSSTNDQLVKILSFTGLPSDLDIQEIGLSQPKCREIIKRQHLNNHQISRKEMMKNINEDFRDLLQKILVFNPKKRVTIEQILSHSLFSFFSKQKEDLISKSKVVISINDNKKLTASHYREIIYKKQIGSQKLVNQSSRPTEIQQNQSQKNIIKKIKSCKDISRLGHQIVSKTHLKYPEMNKIPWRQHAKNVNYLKSPEKILNKKQQHYNYQSEKTVDDREQLKQQINNKIKSPIFSPNEAKKSLKQFLWDSPVKKQPRKILLSPKPKI